MSSDTSLAESHESSVALGHEAAEHERQFREILDFCPAALMVVDEDGRLLFHNARLREILGYSKEAIPACTGMTSSNESGSSNSYGITAARF